MDGSDKNTQIEVLFCGSCTFHSITTLTFFLFLSLVKIVINVEMVIMVEIVIMVIIVIMVVIS